MGVVLLYFGSSFMYVTTPILYCLTSFDRDIYLCVCFFFKTMSILPSCMNEINRFSECTMYKVTYGKSNHNKSI